MRQYVESKRTVPFDLDKWNRELQKADLLKKYRLEEFIKIVEVAGAIEEFDMYLYFKMTEKMIVFQGEKVVVSLLDGIEVECKIL